MQMGLRIQIAVGLRIRITESDEIILFIRIAQIIGIETLKYSEICNLKSES